MEERGRCLMTWQGGAWQGGAARGRRLMGSSLGRCATEIARAEWMPLKHFLSTSPLPEGSAYWFMNRYPTSPSSSFPPPLYLLPSSSFPPPPPDLAWLGFGVAGILGWGVGGIWGWGLAEIWGWCVARIWGWCVARI